mmetsp:Transcript_98719/g.156067  ORF Transcript_98719/g.156067 Transcript_98719/m.156067 type:complete len:213 (+) Transcript_98719:48-686(+)
MSHCTDFKAWKECLERERRMDLIRKVPESTADLEAHADLVNPYNAKRFFAKGLAHMFYNDSAQARLVMAPNTTDPLRTQRHRSHMVATREGLGPNGQVVERLSKPAIDLKPLDLESAQQNNVEDAIRREKSISWRLQTPSEISCISASVTAEGYTPRQDYLAKTMWPRLDKDSSPLSSPRGSSRSGASSIRKKDRRGFSRTANYGKMLLPIT